jgi:hypothetical protein
MSGTPGAEFDERVNALFDGGFKIVDASLSDGGVMIIMAKENVVQPAGEIVTGNFQKGGE